MPYHLITKLKKLMQHQEVANLLPKEIENKTEQTLPFIDDHVSMEVLVLVDDIRKTAFSIFGTKLKPSIHQQAIMEMEGFPIVPGNVEHSVWKKANIRTPKGFISYY